MPILITNEPTSDFGGIQRYVARLAVTLSQRGWQTTLLEPKADERRDWPGVRTVRFSSGGRVSSTLSALAAYVREIGDRSEVTIASVWFPSGLVAAVVPTWLRGPLAILAHGSEIAPHRKGLRRSLMRWTFGRADLVIANSRYTRELLSAAGIKTKTTVIPCGVDARKVERRPSLDPTVLAVGRLVARKGFDRLVQAMPNILQSVPNARLRLVGNGPMRDELGELARKLDVSAHIDFLGALNDADLEAEYAQAWCFAMPCRRIGDDVEGFGIVYLEAAMAGLPSVGGRGSGAEDAIVHSVTGELVDGEHVESIATAVSSYLRDAGLCEMVGARARQRAMDEFSWPRVTERIEDALTLRRLT